MFSRAAAENPGKFGLDNANIVKLVPFPNLSLKPNEKNQLVYMAMYVNKSNELVPVEGKTGQSLFRCLLQMKRLIFFCRKELKNR